MRLIVSSLILILSLLCLSSLSLAASNPNDRGGSKDPPYFSRMPGFHITNSQDLSFDRHEFPVSSDKKEAVEGHRYEVFYANDSANQPSGLQITRNYLNAAKALGGEKLYEFEDGGTQYITLKVPLKEVEVWAEVSAAGNGMYTVQLVEKQLITQDVQVVDAASMAEGINTTGKIAVYGIYFDTDKAELKPQSEPALQEIVKLLQADAKLKVYVVGHTDNVGSFDHNVKLSKDRANSVVSTLTKKYGIAQARLLPYGDGPTAPVATNDAETGRAKNRRVELVKQ